VKKSLLDVEHALHAEHVGLAVFADAARELLALPETLQAGYSNADLRFNLTATGRPLSFTIPDDGLIEALQMELTLQGDTRCKIALNLKNPAGGSLNLPLAEQTSPTPGEGHVSFAAARPSDALGAFLGQRTGGAWTLSAAAPDPCSTERPVIRKLRFLTSIR
jgi:hypothetical protein